MTNVAIPPLEIFELAAGTGMLGLGLIEGLRAIRLDGEIVGACEWEATAASALMAQLEHSQGSIPPVFDDAARWFGRSAWRSLRGLEHVDAVAAGYPCQPFSSAGKRGGSRDARHLWPACRRAVAGLQPSIVFFENVDGHVSMGLWKVLRDIERLGYRVTAGVFSADEVGASHLRKRVFILGVMDNIEHRMRQGEQGEQEQARLRRDRRADTGQKLADSRVTGLQGRLQRTSANTTGRQVQGERRPATDGNAMGDGTDGSMRRMRRSDNAESPMSLFPPARDDYRRWAQLVAGDLEPTLMPAIESGVSVVADGMASPADLLRLGGNGVVPLCAAWAFINLFACLMEPVDDPAAVGPLFAGVEC